LFEIKRNVVEDSKAGKKNALKMAPINFYHLFYTLSKRGITNKLKVLDLSRNQWDASIFDEIFKGLLMISKRSIEDEELESANPMLQ
jgi:hypothetical protein